jgi:mRNA interferase MazF
MPDPVAGEVWTVWFDRMVGHEQAGVRPALVVSNAAYNDVPHGLRIIVPITSRNRDVVLHYPVDPPEGGLTIPSVIMCEQVVAQSLQRFRRKRGEVTAETLAAVQAIIGMFIDRP